MIKPKVNQNSITFIEVLNIMNKHNKISKN